MIKLPAGPNLLNRLSNAATAADLAAHSAASDPHTGYQRENEKNQINGYAGLDGAGKVPTGQIPAISGYVADAIYTTADQVVISSGTAAYGAYTMNDATILAKPTSGAAGPCDPPTVRTILGIQNRLTHSNFTTCVGGTGGATNGTLACEIRTIDAGGADQVYVKLVASTTQYGGLGNPNANVTLSAVNPGDVMASSASAGWWIIRTGALGTFGCTINNSVDETVYFSVQTADCSSSGTGTLVYESVPSAAIWSA